jgi:hypothetical protein
MSRSSRIFIQPLESRTLLSGWGFSGGFGQKFSGGGKGHFSPIPNPPDATIQADLTAVQNAKTQLQTDWKADGPTIKADLMALAAARKTARADVSSTLTTQLTTDQGTLKTAIQTLHTDFKDGASSTTITADKSAVKTDETAVQNDQAAINSAINANPAVVAAQTQLTTDSATIKADQSALQAAEQKLWTDIKDNA